MRFYLYKNKDLLYFDSLSEILIMSRKVFSTLSVKTVLIALKNPVYIYLRSDFDLHLTMNQKLTNNGAK
tara:strand:- start:6247 stop:6453 length:207 start_codon:yes stop_codon:yes gene_type:complete